MGCSYSVEEVTEDDYRVVHDHDPSFLIDDTIHPGHNSGQTIQLTMKKHLWKTNDSNNVYRTPTPASGSAKTATTTKIQDLQPYDVSLTLSDSPHEFLLKNTKSNNGRTIAVIKHIEGRYTHTFKVYTFRPYSPKGNVGSTTTSDGGQQPSPSPQPSRIHSNGQPLYEWAEIVEQTKDGDQYYDMTTSEDGISYQAVRFGPMLGVRQLKVLRNDVPCGMIQEDPHWSDKDDVYLVTIGPGIDPCLIISMSAAIDDCIEMTKIEKQLENDQRHQHNRQNQIRYQQQQIIMNTMNSNNN